MSNNIFLILFEPHLFNLMLNIKKDHLYVVFHGKSHCGTVDPTQDFT